MIRTITTISYCVVKEGKAFEGTKEGIVSQICTFKFDNKNQLVVQFKGFNPVVYHSYNSEFTEKEMYKDAIKFIFNKLKDYGYHIYRNIGY